MALPPFAGPPPIFLHIDRAMRTGAMGEAVRLALLALDQGHVDPVLFNLRAYAHEAQGNFEAALDDLQRALALAPNDSRILNTMGRCLTSLGRPDEALAMLETAIALEPEFAAAHYNRAFALEQQGELDAARASYNRAAALDPNMIDAVARLAALAARRSDAGEARKLADQVLRLDPDHAVAQIALIMVELSERRYSAAEVRARRVMASPITLPQASANAQNFLGDALDGQDKLKEAFAAYAQSNAALRVLFQKRFEAEGSESGLAVVKRLTRELRATKPPDWAQPLQSPSPIFLLGFPRSGTTLLGQILGSHPDVVSLEEKPLLKEVIENYLLPKNAIRRLADLPEHQRARYRELYWRHAREAGADTEGKLVLDQSPFNTLHLPVIATLFPGAKVIFALRDPRDVVLSCFRRLFALNRYVYEFLLGRAAAFYDATMTFAQQARETLNLTIHDLRNEDLVADFDGTAKELCAWLDLPWEKAVADFVEHSKRRAIATPSATQIARGISAESIGQWRRYREEMHEVLPLLAPWVSRFGYASD